MKPTPQISSNQRNRRTFLLTDYQYQTTALSADHAVAKKAPTARELETFRKLSTEFFATEIPPDYVEEFFFFILTTGIATCRSFRAWLPSHGWLGITDGPACFGGRRPPQQCVICVRETYRLRRRALL